MFETLEKLANYVAFSGQERKVQKYLDNATADSILLDLNLALASHITQIDRLRAIFECYGAKETAQPSYWTAKSFETYVRDMHASIDESEIELLWRCFYFYAYHPFPKDFTEDKLDLDAFLRATALLATRGTRLLAMQDDGSYYWRYDGPHYRENDFQRIFRSIGRLAKTKTVAGNPDPSVLGMREDTMDVLAMVVPSSISLAPSPDQLEPAACRLLGERGYAGTTHAVSLKDVSVLLNLLLRQRLEKTTWGSGFHFGSFDDAKLQDKELASSLLSGVLVGSVEDCLTVNELTDIMNLLPSIQLQFYQLWSTIFQPHRPVDQIRHEQLQAENGRAACCSAMPQSRSL